MTWLNRVGDGCDARTADRRIGTARQSKIMRKMTEKMHWRMFTNRLVVSILFTSVAFFGICFGIAGADIVDRILVVVNDDIILLSELEKVMSSMKASFENQGVPLDERQRILDNQRPNVLEQLIQDKLTDQQVARHKLKVTDEEVDATIQRIREANALSEEEFRRAVELDGMRYEDYRDQIRSNILRSRLVNREVKSKIVITDSDIKKFYDANIDRYTGSTKYSLRHILLKLSPVAPDSQRTRVSEEINLIRDRLKAGEPFEELAEQFSDAPTASNGGRLGVFGTQLLTEEIRAALEGLQPKQYSSVVETDQGFQVFFVEDIIRAGGKSLEEAAPEIRDKLYADVVNQKFKTWLEDLRKRSHIQILE